MTTFQYNDKVYTNFGDNQVAAIVLDKLPLLEDPADLIWLKIAVRNPYFADRWIVTEYPDPVQSSALTARSSLSPIPGLDTYSPSCITTA